MGPTPRENQRDGVDEDGWYIGYEVQMEGVGIVNVYGETANTESESDGWVGPDVDSDDEHAATRRAGYVAVPSMVESDDDDDDDEANVQEACDSATSEVGASTSADIEQSRSHLGASMSPFIGKAFDKAMSNAEKLYAQHEELKFNAPPLDIPLSQDKVDAIRSAMSGIKLAKPTWIDKTCDDQLVRYVNERKHKEK